LTADLPLPSNDWLTGARRYRLWMSLAALLCLGLQVPGSLTLSLIALTFWVALLVIADRVTLARLWMPRFWLITLVFALGSGLLLGPKAKSGPWALMSRQGLEAGLLMMARGALIFGLTAWASRALGGQELRRAAARVGLSRLGSSLSVALQLLPELNRELRSAWARDSGGRGRLRRATALAVDLLVETARLSRRIALGTARALPDPASRSSDSPRPILAAVVGAPRTGKTTLTLRVLERLNERALSVGGVTQPAIGAGAHPAGYMVRCAASGKERLLATRRDRGQRGFCFQEQGWTWAQECIHHARLSAEVLVVDELGRLESRGEGHLPALLATVPGERVRVYLLAVRADCARLVEERLGRFDLVLQTGCDGEALGQFVASVVSACAPSPPREAECAASAAAATDTGGP